MTAAEFIESGGWIVLDTDAKGLAEAHEKLEKEFAEKILERLLELNLARAAEEAAAEKKISTDKSRKPKKSRAKKADKMQ